MILFIFFFPQISIFFNCQTLFIVKLLDLFVLVFHSVPQHVNINLQLLLDTQMLSDFRLILDHLPFLLFNVLNVIQTSVRTHAFFQAVEVLSEVQSWGCHRRWLQVLFQRSALWIAHAFILQLTHWCLQRKHPVSCFFEVRLLLRLLKRARDFEFFLRASRRFSDPSDLCTWLLEKVSWLAASHVEF